MYIPVMATGERKRNREGKRIRRESACRPVILIELLLCVCGTADNYEIETIGSVTDNGLIHTYSVYKNETIWTDADNRCATFIPNNHLAILDSADKISQLTSQLNNDEQMPLWIGGHLNYSAWTWLDNSSLEQRGSVAPGSGSCLSLIGTNLTAIPCEKELRHYMCSINGPCPPDDGICQLNSSSKSIVLFNSGDLNVTWNKARNKCLSWNGDLASLPKGTQFNSTHESHVGGQRTLQWWWAYGSATRVKALSQTDIDSLVITEKETLDLCLVLTRQGLAAANCTDEYFVLCEDTQTTPSDLRKVYIIIGVFFGVFILFLLMMIALGMHLRRVRRKRASDQDDHHSIQNSTASPSAQTNPYKLETVYAYMEALEAHPDS